MSFYDVMSNIRSIMVKEEYGDTNNQILNVKNVLLPNGAKYIGSAKSNGNNQIPHGMGVCTFRDHQEIGMYQDGVLNGITYLNYHSWMQVGVMKDGTINGWGAKIDMGEITFGVFRNNKLVVDLTPLVEIFWNKIKDECRIRQKTIISALKSGELFIGVPPYLLTKYENQLGFHFLNNGELFLGVSGYRETAMTGKFLHFDLEYNVTRGEFENGELIREINDEDFISACDVFVNRTYADFDISRNFSPESVDDKI